MIKKYFRLSSVSLFLPLLAVVDLRAATFTYSYDTLNRITNAACSDGSRESYSYDNAGNRQRRVTLAATTLLDVTPPTVPTNLTWTAFIPSQLSIAWNRSSDTGGSGLAGYYIYLNGSMVAMAASTNFSFSGLFPNSQYCLTVAAFDHDNNVSAQSDSLCTNTPVFQPPSLNSVFANGQLQIGANGGTSGPYDVFGSSNLLVWRWETNVWLPLSNNYFVPQANGLDPYFYRLNWSTNAP
jgi:YD repeat-containing protein